MHDGIVWFHAVYLTLGSGPSITTNNVEIPITTIGEDGGLPSLTCHTDLTACCRSAVENNNMGGLGQWTYPDGSVILNNPNSAADGQQFFVLRNDAQVIRLARRDGNNPLTPTGTYCCTVPTTGGEMTLCANLGENYLSMSCFLFYSASMQYVFTPSLGHMPFFSPMARLHNVKLEKPYLRSGGLEVLIIVHVQS